MRIELEAVPIEIPDGVNVILGQSHFIKTVDDMHEALVAAVPGILFGLAFCEASGPSLVRASGTEAALVQLAKRNALNIGAGHSFIVMLGQGCFPINVLNSIKLLPEVCRVLCATGNPTQVIVAETDQGRGILGVIDGERSKGVEADADVVDRRALLRSIGYKL